MQNKNFFHGIAESAGKYAYVYMQVGNWKRPVKSDNQAEKLLADNSQTEQK